MATTIGIPPASSYSGRADISVNPPAASSSASGSDAANGHSARHAAWGWQSIAASCTLPNKSNRIRQIRGSSINVGVVQRQSVHSQVKLLDFN
eukprot:3317933-Amphidinium_carterae.1